MSADRAPKPGTERSEPQPWRTPDDVKGWRVVGVGKRHPRWLEFEITAIAFRHDPASLVVAGAASDAYRPAARTLAERLRSLDPAAAAREQVASLTRDAFAAHYDGRAAAPEATYRSMADEIMAAWRAHTERMAGVAPT